MTTPNPYPYDIPDDADVDEDDIVEDGDDEYEREE